MTKLVSKIKSQDLTTRALLMAIGYTLFWLLVHWLYTHPRYSITWIFPQFIASLLFYFCLNGLFATFNYYRYRTVPQILVSLFYFQPVFQIGYYQTYKTFLEQQNLSLLLREPQFIFNVFAKEISFFQAVLFIGAIALLYFINRTFLAEPRAQEEAVKPYLLFHSKWVWLGLAIAIAGQVKWVLKHDSSQITMRPAYPVAILALLSILVFLFKTRKTFWKRTFWKVFLALNVTQLYALNLGFPEFRDKMSLDSRYYRALFGAYFVNTALDTLDQSDRALDKFTQLPKAEMSYNILFIIDDSQRWDFSERHGYPRETDRQLNWFYDQAYDFQFPISPANFTDTAVPAVLTGLGSNRDVLDLKGNLVFWDYFAKGAETFFITTQILVWSRLDLFYDSIGQKHVWSTPVHSDFKKNSELADDSYLVREIQRYMAEKKAAKQNWAGTLQMFSSHYPYNHYPPAPQPHAPCDLTRESGPESFANCYANGQISAAWAKSDILKSTDLENTIVILTSDHGEGFNEHGIWFHGVDYHQEMVKVPLFIYIPPKIKAKIPAEMLKNLEKNTKKIVSTLDLLPTLLEIHELVSGQKLYQDMTLYSGQSLLHDWQDRLVFSSHCYPQYRCYSREIALVNEEYYVLFRPSEGFYKVYDTFKDLKQVHPIDPRQIPPEKLQKLVDTAAETHSIGQSLKAYYETWK